ncbi:hypothetical protein J6590_009824 [Homalodisca vitripennis]|nr:hypothetical protein J6590_009824 [Homalodisca vitripennis]
MTGAQSNVVAKIKMEASPLQHTFTAAFIGSSRDKQLSSELKIVLNDAVKKVNFIKSRGYSTFDRRSGYIDSSQGMCNVTVDDGLDFDCLSSRVSFPSYSTFDRRSGYIDSSQGMCNVAVDDGLGFDCVASQAAYPIVEKFEYF